MLIFRHYVDGSSNHFEESVADSVGNLVAANVMALAYSASSGHTVDDVYVKDTTTDQLMSKHVNGVLIW